MWLQSHVFDASSLLPFLRNFVISDARRSPNEALLLGNGYFRTCLQQISSCLEKKHKKLRRSLIGGLMELRCFQP